MVSESKLPMPLGLNNATNANVQNNSKDDSYLTDQIKRRWMVKSSFCDYNELQQMLKDYPKLAEFKDITSGKWSNDACYECLLNFLFSFLSLGFNALHWAAKFNKPDIIKLIAGTHNVNPDIRTVSILGLDLFFI